MNDAAPTRRTIAPVVMGIALTVSFLALLAYLGRQRNQTAVVPALTLIAPARGAVVDSPLVIRFAASRPVALKPTGWGAGRLHLHAWIDDVAHMPAAADIQPLGDTTFTWVLPATRTTHTLQLGWADAAHRELTRGRSDTVTIVVR